MAVSDRLSPNGAPKLKWLYCDNNNSKEKKGHTREAPHSCTQQIESTLIFSCYNLIHLT
jgi:hypothetical protein